jgi:deazaflavin-dependent oxidoreductase (nitroreductase family)
MSTDAILDPATGQPVPMDEATGMPTDMKAFNRAVVADLRANDGIANMGPLKGSPLAIVTTTGRRTGTRHATPMAFAQHDDAIVVVASNNAAAEDPDWYRNLVADPKVTVEVGGDAFESVAATAAGAARQEIIEAVVERLPFIPSHEEQVEREIPIVVLERA